MSALAVAHIWFNALGFFPYLMVCCHRQEDERLFDITFDVHFAKTVSVKSITIEAAVIYSRLLQMAHGQQLVLTYSTCMFITSNLVSSHLFQLVLHN